jgi:hypothetical protein
MKNLLVKGKKEILRPDMSERRMAFPSCHCEADFVSRSNLVNGRGDCFAPLAMTLGERL